MTNMVHTCFILQYIYYIHLRVSSIIRMLINRRLNCIDAASGIVLSVSGRLLCSTLPTCAPDDHCLRGRYQMLHQYSSAS